MTIRRFFVCVVFFSLVSTSHAKVSIEINGRVSSYDDNPRLAEVLAPVAEQAAWYWPSAQLFNLVAPSIAMQKDQLLKLLRDEAASNRKAADDYLTMVSDIQSWRVADRIEIDIDFDLARFSISHNPKFENGDYLLKLSKRPAKLYVFGAVPAPVSIDFVENQCVYKSIADIQRSSIADLNHIYIISPRATVTQVPIAYWNRGCVVPMPGSLIYIPIQEYQWPTTAKLINQQVTSLVLNRVQLP